MQMGQTGTPVAGKGFIFSTQGEHGSNFSEAKSECYWDTT